MQKNADTIGTLFRSLSKGDQRTMAVLKTLAATAHQIDPKCPYGARGLLWDIQDSGLSPQEVTALYRNVAKSDPLTMNALFYGIFLKKITGDDLRRAINTGGQNLRMSEIERGISQHNKRFGQYYNRPSRRI